MHLRVVVGGILVMVALGAIAIAGYFANQMAYYTVDQLAASGDLPSVRPAATDGPRIQLRGVVDKTSVERPEAGLQMRFDLEGKDLTVPVAYEGIVPDTFDLAESVTVAGAFGSDGTFHADELFVQCPSKYQAQPPGEVARSNG